MLEEDKMEKDQKTTINKVFISHSSFDKEYAECMVQLLTDIGISHEKIFCSSVKGYGIPGGVNFLEYIRATLDSNVVVISLLTDRFYNSKVSLCEMGATWVKTNIQIPIVIPPFTYDDIEGVIKGIQGYTINDKEDINELKNRIENLFDIKPVNTNIWEKRRDGYLVRISKILQQETQTLEYNNEEIDETKMKKFIFYIIRDSAKKMLTTMDVFGELKKEYGVHKKGYEIYDIYNLLEELDYSGKIKKLDFDGTTMETMLWRPIL